MEQNSNKHQNSFGILWKKTLPGDRRFNVKTCLKWAPTLGIGRTSSHAVGDTKRGNGFAMHVHTKWSTRGVADPDFRGKVPGRRNPNGET